MTRVVMMPVTANMPLHNLPPLSTTAACSSAIAHAPLSLYPIIQAQAKKPALTQTQAPQKEKKNERKISSFPVSQSGEEPLRLRETECKTRDRVALCSKIGQGGGSSRLLPPPPILSVQSSPVRRRQSLLSSFNCSPPLLSSKVFLFKRKNAESEKTFFVFCFINIKLWKWGERWHDSCSTPGARSLDSSSTEETSLGNCQSSTLTVSIVGVIMQLTSLVIQLVFSKVSSTAEQRC